MLYFIVKHFWLLVIRVKQPIRLYRKENILKKGAFLFVANHQSSNDPFLLSAGTRRHLAFMGKDSLFAHPVGNFILRQLGAYPINREANPKEVLDLTIEILRRGKPTTMFPEGNRNKENDELRSFKKGAALVAIRAGVPVIPAAILGTNRKDGPISVWFGEAIQPPSYSRENLQVFNEEMEAAVGLLVEKLKPLHYARVAKRSKSVVQK